jgi:microcystin-dependent protein
MAKARRQSNENVTANIAVTSCVGDVVPSVLSEVQFQSLRGTGWILCDGRSITGSALAVLTGDSTAPDLRGRVVAGKDDMGGSAANRLTVGGSGIAGNSLKAVGGAETHTLSQAQLAAHGHNVTDAGGTQQSINNVPTGSASGPIPRGSTFNTTSNLITSNSGSGSAHQNTQPTMVLNFFVRIN